MGDNIPSAIVLYHFFYPDDVVSAVHFSQFSQELVNRGWNVTVLTSNRYCHYPKKKISKKHELWNGINIIRLYRPPWNQAKNFFRLLNSAWMLFGWTFKILFAPRANVIVVGSDPPFSALLFPFIRIFKRKMICAHWCYDLYPEAIISDGATGFLKWIIEKLKIIMKWAYRDVELMVDIGPCMRKRLQQYNHKAKCYTLVPWALVEPNELERPDPAVRSELFHDAELALFYSGNMGKAHDFDLFIRLARKLSKQNPKIVICFACRGNRYNELIRAVKKDDSNIRFASFANEADLQKRLVSADIHLVSLRDDWEGVVVPSKFFGSLAVGRPVIYSGPEHSALAEWIRKYNVGMVLTEASMDHIAEELIYIAKQPQRLDLWKRNAFDVYRKNFSKNVIMNQWDEVMRDLVYNYPI